MRPVSVGVFRLLRRSSPRKRGSSSSVIPGRGRSSANPESKPTPSLHLDSGSGANAPSRNDGVPHGELASPLPLWERVPERRRSRARAGEGSTRYYEAEPLRRGNLNLGS